MQAKRRKIRVGIIGCGAIGSGIAEFIQKDLKKDCQLTGFYDIDYDKVARLNKKLLRKEKRRTSLKSVIKESDVVVEAVNAENTKTIIQEVLKARKSVIAMSVGKLLNAPDIFRLAHKNHCQLLLPSGAIAGIDAVKAASLGNIRSIKLTTRKPPSGFIGNAYVQKKKINLSSLKKETVIYKGNVEQAVLYFPQNINVAATLALASGVKGRVNVCIITSPEYTGNSHEIEIVGDFGRITTRADNVISPSNPKTSYLAVLSGMETLKQYVQGVYIGT